MRKTYFLLNNNKKENKDFLKENIRKALGEITGDINLILSPKEKLLHIDPRCIHELKKAEKTGKFKIKKFKEHKRRFEKIINKMFNHSGFIPDNYCISEHADLLIRDKHRIKLYILPITQQMLCYDWRCKLLLNNSNLTKNDSLISEYIKLRMERTEVLNSEILSFLNSIKGNNIVLLNEVNHSLITKFSENKEIYFPENRIYIPEVIIKEEIFNK